MIFENYVHVLHLSNQRLLFRVFRFFFFPRNHNQSFSFANKKKNQKNQFLFISLVDQPRLISEREPEDKKEDRHYMCSLPQNHVFGLQY